MIIFELSKEDMNYADKISELADMSTTIVVPKSFSSNLNDVIQIAVELSPYVISAVSLIIIEMIKSSKKLKIKIGKDSIEAEGFSEEKMLELAEKYIKQQKEDQAKEVLNKLLSQNGGN